MLGGPGPAGRCPEPAGGARLSGVPTLAEDRDAIRDLFARYCLYIDTGAADEWAATFTEDGEFLRAGADPLTGREALKAFATSLSSSTLHHMVLNEIIDIDGDTATCRSSVFVTSKGAVGLDRPLRGCAPAHRRLMAHRPPIVRARPPMTPLRRNY